MTKQKARLLSQARIVPTALGQGQLIVVVAVHVVRCQRSM